MKEAKLSKTFIPIKYAVSVMAVVCGLAGVLLYAQYDTGDLSFFALGYPAMVISGLVSAVMLYRGRSYTLALVGFAIGFSVFVKFADLLWVDLAIKFDDPTYIKNIIYYLFTVFGVMIMYAAVRMYMGFRRNAARLAVYMAVPIIMTLVSFIYLTVNRGYDTIEICKEYHFMIPLTVLTVVYEIGLFQSTLIEKSQLSRVKMDVDKVSMNTFTDPNAKMQRSELARMVKILNGNEEWNGSEGIYDGEFTVIMGTKKDQRKLVFKKITLNQNVILTVLPAEYDGYINAFRMTVRGVTPIGNNFKNCDRIRIFGNDGVFIDILISDDDTGEDNTLDDDATFLDAFSLTLGQMLPKRNE